jgi:mitochondrial-processing peptidase subunit beta
MPLAHLAIAFKSSSWTDPSSIPLMVIQSILGSWKRSIGVGNCSGYEKYFLQCTFILLPILLPKTDFTFFETERSALARGISSGNLAESLMAFNTNYRYTGLFGIYTTALVKSITQFWAVIVQLACA